MVKGKSVGTGMNGVDYRVADGRTEKIQGKEYIELEGNEGEDGKKDGHNCVS